MIKGYSELELLQFAAKACGFTNTTPAYRADDDGYITNDFWYLHVPELKPRTAWNPLINSDEALQLSALLEIDLQHNWESIIATYAVGRSVKSPVRDEDRLKAMREAIVLAAAEMGKDLIGREARGELPDSKEV